MNGKLIAASKLPLPDRGYRLGQREAEPVAFQLLMSIDKWKLG